MSLIDKLSAEALAAMNEREDYEQAYALWQKVLEQLSKDEPHPTIGQGLASLNMAICASRSGRQQTAVDLAAHWAQLIGRTVGNDSDEAQRALFILTEVSVAAGQPERAVEASDRALAAIEGAAWVHPRTVVSTVQKRIWLAEALDNEVAYDDAVIMGLAYLDREEQASEALQADKRRDYVTELRFQRAQLLESRGSARMAAGRLDDAQTDLREAVWQYEQAWGPGDETADDARALLEQIALHKSARG